MRVFATFLLLLTASFAFAAERPLNVVLIISDDHGWGDYGFMGHPHVKTPHLDRLAVESVVYSRGYVPSSLCCPSLATIITGLPPHQHKITGNDPPLVPGLKAGEYQKSPVFLQGRETMARHLEAVPTLPRLLAKQGYLSLQTGKWWQGDFRRGGFTHGMTKGQRHGDDGLTIGRQTMQPIYDFIDEAEKAKKPFFVWYAPFLPHTPHNPPQRLLAKYRDKTPSIHVARYWAMIEWFDETCGQLLKHLDDRNLRDNTLIVYVADNGWTQNPERGDSIRSKRTPYDAGLRTPIMVRCPGVMPRASDDLASSQDILPTILKACEVSVPENLPGIDLLNTTAVEKRSSLFGCCFTHNAVDLNEPSKNVRHRWMIDRYRKLIVPHVPADKDGPGSIELYDLENDPEETKNLAGKHPEEVKALQAKLDAWWNPSK